jgi:hypothetical protein
MVLVEVDASRKRRGEEIKKTTEQDDTWPGSRSRKAHDTKNGQYERSHAIHLTTTMAIQAMGT